jgi:glycosyltransferase involved in cell wall biosynthesis
MSTSVIICTYNSPLRLRKMLWGFFRQSRDDFELLIADDGSHPEAGELLRGMAVASAVPIAHVWQQVRGVEGLTG